MAQTAASNWWLCCPAGARPESWGKAASPSPGLEAMVSGSSILSCPCGFGCLSPRHLAMAGRSVCSSRLRTGRKWEENIQRRDTGQTPDVMGLLIRRVRPSLAEQAWGDRAWWGGEWGAEEIPSSSGGRQGEQRVKTRAGVRAVCGPVSCCVCLSRRTSKGDGDVEGCRVQLNHASPGKG